LRFVRRLRTRSRRIPNNGLSSTPPSPPHGVATRLDQKRIKHSTGNFPDAMVEHTPRSQGARAGAAIDRPPPPRSLSEQDLVAPRPTLKIETPQARRGNAQQRDIATRRAIDGGPRRVRQTACRRSDTRIHQELAVANKQTGTNQARHRTIEAICGQARTTNGA